MLSYLRNIFRKKSDAAPVAGPYMVHGSAARPQARANGPAAAAVPAVVPRVETAQLQLAAIIAKFPDELRKLVVKLPSPEAMVALPLPTIQKFLPTGSVKMSLASVVRQAPPGTFAAINTGDKRLVEVPLAEIFKRISPAVLRRRDDQKFTDLAAEGFDIFGDDENPHALAPRCEDGITPSLPSSPAAVRSTVPQGVRGLQPPLGSGIIPPPGVASAPRAPLPPQPSRVVTLPDEMQEVQIPRMQAPPTAVPPPPLPLAPPVAPVAPQAPVTADPTSHAEAGEPPVTEGEESRLVLPIKDLAQGWPEPIKSEAYSLNGTTVSLPAGNVSVGLAKGKVAFAWGQLRSWMEPSPSTPTAADEGTELLLPLRVVAPAFLKHSKQAQQRKSVTMDESIPALFGPARGADELPATELIPTPAAEPEPEPIAAPVHVEEAAHHPEAPAAEVIEQASDSITVPAEELPATVPEFRFAETAAAPAVAHEEQLAPQTDSPPKDNAPETQTLGEAFGVPGKEHWSPSEIVANLVKMPCVAGAAVALQEGLVIAHHLPEPMKGEVFAAFLPQIFARLTQYANEMKLGAVEDILIQSAHGPCHVFRRGQVFFAALGRVGETLPTPVLRLCANALSE